MTTRICKGCNEVKDLECFSTNKCGKFGRHSRCMPCCTIQRRKWSNRTGHARGIKRRYDMTLDQFNTILAQQDNRCAICRGAAPKGKNWHVDHNHISGKIRGILCSTCNRGIGWLNADKGVETLLAAIEYVRNADNG